MASKINPGPYFYENVEMSPRALGLEPLPSRCWAIPEPLISHPWTSKTTLANRPSKNTLKNQPVLTFSEKLLNSSPKTTSKSSSKSSQNQPWTPLEPRVDHDDDFMLIYDDFDAQSLPKWSPNRRQNRPGTSLLRATPISCPSQSKSRFRDSGTQGFKDSGIQGFRDSGIQ